MKKVIRFVPFLFLITVILTNCTDQLNRDPVSEITEKNFFKTEKDLKLYTNSFYPIFPEASIYNGDNLSDNIMENTIPARVRGDRVVPTDAGSGGWTWNDLRDINYFFNHYKSATGTTEKQKYSGVAHFFRAYFYFQKVKRFGDVPWYSKPISPDDRKALQKKRDPRNVVIDSVMADLNYAIKNLSSDKSVYRITKWTALALKTRVSLYEGSWEEYHQGTKFGVKGSNGKKYLQACVTAAKKLMDSGMYQIYSTGNPQSDYRNLFSAHDAIAEEVILAHQFNSAQQIDHNINYYTTTSSYGKPGMPKDMINSYLMKDGSRFTDRQNFQQKEFVKEVKNRDPRLSQTIRTPGYHRKGSSKVIPPDFGATVTGYQLDKFTIEPQYDTFDTSINDLPIFRYAEVLLNYAEAKAELESLTQRDLDNSINLIRDRVGMPSLTLPQANSNPDPFLEKQYLNINNGSNKGIILEIRRERRIELYMENFRWDDLMRWKEGQKLTQPFRGMYFPGPGNYDLENDEDIDLIIYTGEVDASIEGAVYLKLGEDIVLDNKGLVNPHPNINSEDRTFDESKDYLFPIPRTELLLNENLEQNPGW